MASKARDLVQAMIRRRVAKQNKINEAKVFDSPVEVIESFLVSFDNKLAECKCPSKLDRYWLMKDEPIKLMNYLQKIDSECSIELRWHGDDLSNIRLEGVKITWSDDFVAVSGEDKEMVVDVFSMSFK